MKLVNEGGYRYLEFAEGKGFLSLINDWQQVFGKWNWYSFHFLHLYIEKDLMVGENYEFSIAILGLGFTLRYTASLNPELEKRVEEIMAKEANK